MPKAIKAILELKEMPRVCAFCPIIKYGHTAVYCGATGGTIENYLFSKLPDCPLKLVEEDKE